MRPGTKLVRKFYKAKHGEKANAETAWKWYDAWHPKPMSKSRQSV